MNLRDIATVEALKTAAMGMRLTSRAGLDRMTVEQLRFALEKTDLAHITTRQLLEGKYQPGKLVGCLIPKPNSDKMRLILVPGVLDRAVQRMIVAGLTPQTEERFHPWSFGFRPNRSIQQALKQASDFIKCGYGWCLLIDLENFFGNIQRERLQKLLRDEYNIDSDIRKLIHAFIRARIVGPKGDSPSIGVPAGMPLAPLLANIYLHVLDRDLERKGIRFVRYADDIALFFQTEAECLSAKEEFLAVCERRYGVRVNVGKTHVTKPGELRPLLGFDLDDSGRITVCTAVIDAIRISLIGLLADRPPLFSTNENETLARKIREKVQSTLAVYRFADNFSDLVAMVDHVLDCERPRLPDRYSPLELIEAAGLNVESWNDIQDQIREAIFDLLPPTSELNFGQNKSLDLSRKSLK